MSISIKSTNVREDLLTEKWRPTEIEQLIGQNHVKNDFKSYIEKKDCPDLILSGPAGTGKTTAALILAKKIAGKGNTLILDASQDNGIDIMRTRVKNFAITYGDPTVSTLKIIIFDEADNITFPAQQALRRTIEMYSKHCRFIFICNYIRKIIDPIQSRCVKYTFEKLDYEEMWGRLAEIKIEEELDITNIDEIIEICNGDLRKCVNYLDAIKKGADSKSLTKVLPEKVFLQYCLKGEMIAVRDFIDKYISDSLDFKTILKNSIELIITSKTLPSELKYKLLNHIGECEYRLTLSTDHYITSQWLCANIYLDVLKYKKVE